MDTDIADIIANVCINHYQSLSKKGKPITGKEWTLLSCVVMTLNGKHTVVAMATGTKCLGRNAMSPRGDLVNDSHSEVLARRCLLRYLYEQILTFQKAGASAIIVGCNEKKQYEINPDIKFHFYSSHVPCGDASIIPKQGVKRKCEIITDQVIKQKKLFIADLKRQGIINEDPINCQDQKKKHIDEGSKILSEDKVNTDSFALQWPSPISSEHSNREFTTDRITDAVIRQSNSFKSNPIKSKEKDFTIQSLLINENDECLIFNGSQDFSHDSVVEKLNDCVGEIVDVYRTGAKCLQGEDRKLPGVLYHQVGAVRTKPGRGDPTLSVSCSDKMARWMVCGLQGALLSLLLSQPVMMTSVIVGSGGPYSQDVLKRALLNRSQSTHSIALLHSSVVFPHSRYSAGLSARPCPSAILWARVSHKPLQVCVEGRRQGATKNCCDNGRLAVCKLELLRTFLSVAKKSEYEQMSYKDLKALADQYNNDSSQVKCALKFWTSKPPHLEDFKLDSRSR